jgi:hypothetical protein
MARIRTIKPEFPHSESMGRVSRESRLCFILLWTIADDAGRLRGNSRMLASLLYPYDDDAKNKIDTWLTQLSNEGCIVRYEFDGTSYIQVINWADHQKIDKPSQSRLPAFVEDSQPFANVREASPADLGPRTKDLGKEGTGEPAGFILPDWINKSHWDAWHSGAKRKKATDAQKQLAVDKLAAWRADGIDHAAALESAAVGGWQGLFLPDKGRAAPSATVPSKPGRDPELERLERDRERATGPSLAVLEQMARIRKGVTA